MIKNKRKSSNLETLAWLKSVNAKLKREKRQHYIDELNRLADIDLKNMYSEIDRIKNELLGNNQSKMITK